jgi:hypothetical protein
MVYIIGESTGTKGFFAQFALDERTSNHITIKFGKIIEDSFLTDAKRKGLNGDIKVTEAEIKNRFEVLCRWFRVLKGDLDFTLNKALDMLPEALRKELDGETYSPPIRNMWIPPQIGD